WPAVRDALGGSARGRGLLDEMEAEHAAIEPLVAAIDDPAAASVADRVDALASRLVAHLEHEEASVLPLIDASLPEAAWLRFGEVHGGHVAPAAARIVPWLLEGASAASHAAIVGRFPPPVRALLVEQWQPAYAALVRWPQGA